MIGRGGYVMDIRNMPPGIGIAIAYSEFTLFWTQGSTWKLPILGCSSLCLSIMDISCIRNTPSGIGIVIAYSEFTLFWTQRSTWKLLLDL